MLPPAKPLGQQNLGESKRSHFLARRSGSLMMPITRICDRAHEPQKRRRIDGIFRVIYTYFSS